MSKRPTNISTKQGGEKSEKPSKQENSLSFHKNEFDDTILPANESANTPIGRELEATVINASDERSLNKKEKKALSKSLEYQPTPSRVQKQRRPLTCRSFSNNLPVKEDSDDDHGNTIEDNSNSNKNEYTIQMDFMRLESDVTDIQLRNQRLTAKNEQLQQRKLELVQEQGLGRHDKQDFENRIDKLNDESLNLKSNHRRDIDELQKQKHIEKREVRMKCSTRTRQQMKQQLEDLKGQKDDELKTERIERGRVEAKYQILFSSNEELQKHDKEAVAKEKATRELLEIKTKELEGIRAEIVKVKHDGERAASEHDASLRDMKSKHDKEMDNLKHLHEKEMDDLKHQHEKETDNLKHEHEKEMDDLKHRHEKEMDNLKHQHEQDITMLQDNSLQRENTLLRKQIDDHRAKQVSTICSIS